MTKLIFILDNLKVGGIQRLALDEAYWARHHGYEVTIISIENIPTRNICSIEQKYFDQSKIEVVGLEGNKLHKLLKLRSLLYNQKGLLGIVCHSPSSAFMARISSLFNPPAKIILYIHQLIELSDRVQKYKRLFLSLFADSIAVSSKQFKLSIESFTKAKFYRRIFRRHIEFDRMGVYLPRIDSNQVYANRICDQNLIHSLFLSRFTAWKGFDTFELVSGIVKNEFNGHSIVITDSESNFRKKNLSNNSDFIHLYFQVSPTTFLYESKTVHIYPSDYGDKVAYPQSIGMNVLELLAIGIPSLVSHEGFESWPEFKESSMLKTCTWENLDDLRVKIIELIENANKVTPDELSKIRNAISINSHMSRLIGYCSN